MDNLVSSAYSNPGPPGARRPFWIALGFALAVHLIVLTALHLPAMHIGWHRHAHPLAVSIESREARRSTPKSVGPAKPGAKTRPATQPTRKLHSSPRPAPHKSSQLAKPRRSVKRPSTPVKTRHSSGKIDTEAWAREAAREAAKAKRKAFDKSPSAPSDSSPYASLPALRKRKPNTKSTPPRIIGGHYRISKVGDQCYATGVSTPKATSPLPSNDPIFSARAVRCPDEPHEDSFAEGLAKRLKTLDKKH